ncbi:MAG: TonB-dependent receptor [Verrucomicrobia bacterium]|nr:TonB-dependent receptor [Verrucomicrobiota bacterium]
MHLSRLLSVTVLTSAPIIAAAADSAPPSPSSAAAHTHAPITLDQFVISAAPFQRNQVDLAQTTTVLSGRSLLLKQQSTLGETLANEPGIQATSFGPGASRPIIRGLGGDRLRLLENGVVSLDASATSPDHAVGIEPFLVERIEAVRGPASLLYGSAAVGGVVNVISHRIETELTGERVRGGAEVRFGSAAEDLARGGVIDLNLLPGRDHALVLHLDGFRRSARDVRIPGFAESARVRAAEAAEAAEHGEEPEEHARYRLPNSALDSEGAAAGLSLVGRNFFVGASRNGFDSFYGVPGHAHGEEGGEEGGVRIRLRQRRTDVQGEWRQPGGWLQGVKAKFGRVNYRHTELEPDGAVGTVFTHRGHDARADLLHGGLPGWTGALGAQSTRSELEAEGDEAFLPPSKTRSQALFAFEELSHGAFTWQAGLRLERTRINAEGQRERRHEQLNGSLGLVWKFDSAWALAASLTRTGRAPNAQELYADGPHAGTQAYEIGDAGLNVEESIGLELSLRRRTGAVTGALTVFTHGFDGYIFEQPTGRVAIEDDAGWEFLLPEAAAATAHGGGLPVYRYVQREARFWGAELEGLWHLHEAQGRQFDVRFTADLTRAEEGGRPLPRIPAARVGLGLLWAVESWSTGVDFQHTLAQRRVAATETSSPGYGQLSAHVSRAIVAGHLRAELFLRATNLTNAEARPHPSFLKDLAPLPGRNFTAGMRVTF